MVAVHAASQRCYAHWASLRYSCPLSITTVLCTLSLAMVAMHTASQLCYAHWASLWYSCALSITTVLRTLSLAVVSVHTALQRYYAHWTLLWYPCIKPCNVIMHTESCCGIRAYSLATVLCTQNLAVVSVHTASQQYYTHWTLLWYPCIQPRNSIMHTEPCCGIRAYSLATVLCTLNLAVVSVHTASLRHSCSPNLRTVSVQ